MHWRAVHIPSCFRQYLNFLFMHGVEKWSYLYKLRNTTSQVVFYVNSCVRSWCEFLWWSFYWHTRENQWLRTNQSVFSNAPEGTVTSMLHGSCQDGCMRMYSRRHTTQPWNRSNLKNTVISEVTCGFSWWFRGNVKNQDQLVWEKGRSKSCTSLIRVSRLACSGMQPSGPAFCARPQTGQSWSRFARGKTRFGERETAKWVAILQRVRAFYCCSTQEKECFCVRWACFHISSEMA